MGMEFGMQFFPAVRMAEQPSGGCRLDLLSATL
jgi:hypothetical protein